jgi:hypothetical protein
MQEFVFFLGRFHVLALHLPIGIVVAPSLDCSRGGRATRRFASRRPLGRCCVRRRHGRAGYLHFAEGARGPSVEAHRFWAPSRPSRRSAPGGRGEWLRTAGVVRLAAGVTMLVLVSSRALRRQPDTWDHAPRSNTRRRSCAR